MQAPRSRTSATTGQLNGHSETQIKRMEAAPLLEDAANEAKSETEPAPVRANGSNGLESAGEWLVVKEAPQKHKSAFDFYLLGSMLAVVATAISNRLLYKMALVPLRNYIFFLAQCQTFGYVIVYVSILLFRIKAGLVTRPMLQNLPYRWFVAIGACEALTSVFGFIGAARIPGVVLPLLTQTILLWQIFLSYIIVGKRFTVTQLAGAGLVFAGVVAAGFPSKAGGNTILAKVNPIYVGLVLCMTFFIALSSVFKDRLFREARARLNGQQLDIFIVNSAGSTSQAFFVFLLLPVLSSLRGLALTELPQYLADGGRCMAGQNPADGSSECGGAPALPLLYMAANLAFNISILHLLRTAGNVVAMLTMSLVVPLSIWSFTLRWPYLPPAPLLGPQFLAGSGVLMLGLLTYNWANIRDAARAHWERAKAA